MAHPPAEVRRRGAQRYRWALALVAFGAVLLVAVTAYQGLTARTALRRVSADVAELRVQLVDGDQDGARSTLERLQSHARSARRDTRGPGWWLLSKAPGIAPNVVAARTVADVTDVLAREVLPEVVSSSSVLQPANLRPVRGRIDLAPLTRVAPAVVAANTRLVAESRRIQAIDARELAPPIAAPVRQLQTGLSQAAGMSSLASQALRLLPPMLGVDGRRTYLMLFQNNAEIRATGGLPGSLAVVTAEHGQVSIGRQVTASSIGRFARPVLPLTAAERGLFGDRMGVFPADVTFTPDFPRTATMIQAMWKARTDTTVDGVLSTDPVALSHLLGGTGPVDVGGGQRLTAGEAVRVLLNQVYLDNPDPLAQDAFFKAVAKKVFRAVASGQGSPSQVLQALATSATERRVLVWSNHPREQALIASTGVGGALTRSLGKAPQVGVYLNDGSESKLDYYLDYHADVSSTRCAEGRQDLTVTVHLRSRVPRDLHRLSPSVLATAPGVPRGTMRTMVMAYVPVDGKVGRATLDGTPVLLTTRDYDGRSMVAQTVDLAPGQRATATYRMTSGPGQTDAADLRVTPGVRGDGVGTVGPSSCRS